MPDTETVESEAVETESPLTCTSCREEIEDGEEWTYGSEPYCEDCFSDQFCACARCEATVPRNGTGTVDDDTTWCASCIAAHSWSCHDCYRSVSAGTAGYNTWRDNNICESCAEDYLHCENCGNLVDDDHSVSRGDSTYCPDCDPGEEEEEEEEESSRINSYSYKPTPRFFHRIDTETHYGVELEVNVSDGISIDNAVEHVGTLGWDHIYLKEDGSIGRGFEIVTHPHSLEKHRELWKRWNVPAGITSHKSGECGIHVHIERSKLMPLQLGKMIVFLNCALNASFIQCIAQRDSSRWGRIDPSKKLTDRYSSERYEALNLLNRNTVELRIFRGNTRTDRILKAVEFADAVVRFCNEASYRSLRYTEFCVWCRQHRSEYPVLDAYLVEKGYLRALPAAKPIAETAEDTVCA